MTQVQFPDSYFDPFNRLRTSEPLTLFDSKQLFDNAPLFWDEAQTSGSGTSSSHSTARASTTMTVSASTSGTRVRQTKRRFNYQPGKGQLVFLTGVLGSGAAGITRRVGYFDENNGLFFQLSGATLSVVTRSSVSGSPVDTAVNQADWNIRELTNRGVLQSRYGDQDIVLDTSKANIFVIDFEWLGVGRVRFGVVIDGVIVYVHQVLNANNTTAVYMSTPNLPLRYEISNDGTGGTATLEHICASVISEGGQESTGAIFSASNGNAPVESNVSGTIYACIGLRLKTTHLAATIENVAMSMLGVTVNDNFQWLLLLNPTVASTFTYGDVSNSAVQVAYGATANTVTGGTLINSGYTAQQTSVTNLLRNTVRLGAKIDGTRDTIVLCVMPIGAASNLDIFASMTWQELA